MTNKLLSYLIYIFMENNNLIKTALLSLPVPRSDEAVSVGALSPVRAGLCWSAGCREAEAEPGTLKR